MIEQIKLDLWRKGIIAPWYLRDHQSSLYNMIVSTVRDFVVPNISRRFGKSTTCVTYAIEEAIKRPNSDVRYSTAFLSDLEGFIIPIFDHVLITCPTELKPKWLASKKLYIFPNGSKIKLIGLDKNPNGIRGNAIDLLIVDEAAFVKNLEYLYRSIIVPATADRQFKIVFPSTPPIDSDHFWALELIPKAKQRGNYLEFTIDDNTHLPEEEKIRLLDEVGGKDSAIAQREFYCKIIRDPELVVIPEYSKSKHVLKLELPRFYIPLTVIDFGGSMDKHGVLICYWDFDRAKFCIYREKLLDKNTASNIIVGATLKIEEDINFVDGETNRIGDAPEQLRIDLSANGFQCRRPRKEKGSLEANINNVRLAFLRDDIEIDQSCINLDLTLEFGSWMPNKGDWRRTDDLGHLDLLAALLYAYKHIDKSNPYPKHWGRSMDKFEKVSEESDNPFLEGYFE